MRLEFCFSHLRLEGPALSRREDVLRRIVADLAVAIDGRTTLAASDVLIVDLLDKLSHWFPSLASGARAFEYRANAGVFALAPADGGWRLIDGADAPEDPPLSDADVKRAVESLKDRLFDACTESFRLNLTDYLI